MDADVDYVGNDGKTVFYTSAEVSPVENHLFSISVTGLKNRRGIESVSKAKFGKPVRLTFEEGWHSVSLSADCRSFIDRFSSFNVPSVTQVRTTDGKLVRELGRAEDPLKAFKTGKVMLGTVKSADGRFDNWYRLYLPADFDPSRKYPVILYVVAKVVDRLRRASLHHDIPSTEFLQADYKYDQGAQQQDGCLEDRCLQDRLHSTYDRINGCDYYKGYGGYPEIDAQQRVQCKSSGHHCDRNLGKYVAGKGKVCEDAAALLVVPLFQEFRHRIDHAPLIERHEHPAEDEDDPALDLPVRLCHTGGRTGAGKADQVLGSDVRSEDGGSDGEPGGGTVVKEILSGSLFLLAGDIEAYPYHSEEEQPDDNPVPILLIVT